MGKEKTATMHKMPSHKQLAFLPEKNSLGVVNRDSRKRQILIGDGTSVVDYIKSKVGKQTIVIGDGKKSITKAELQGLNYTYVTDIIIHGKTVQGQHYIKYDGGQSTAQLFRNLRTESDKSKATKGTPLIVNLWSCFSGAAVQDAKILGEGSVLIMSTDKDHSSFSIFDKLGSTVNNHSYWRDLKPTDNETFNEFIRLIYTCPNTKSFSVVKNGKVKEFITKAPIKALITEEDVKNHLRDTVKDFYKFLQNELDYKILFNNNELDLVTAVANLPEIHSDLLKQYQEYDLINSGFIGEGSKVEDYINAIDNKGNHLFDINKTEAIGGFNCFMAAVAGKVPKLIKLLIDREVNVNFVMDDGATALLFAAQNGHLEIVKTLLTAKNINVNFVSNDGSASALFYAAENGHLEIIKELLAAKNINVNLAMKNGATALFIAAVKGHTEIVKSLLAAKNINVNLAMKNGATALFIAAEIGHLDIVKALLAAKNINVNFASNDGATALVFAAQEGHTEIVKALVTAGADLDVKYAVAGNKTLIQIIQEALYQEKDASKIKSYNEIIKCIKQKQQENLSGVKAKAIGKEQNQVPDNSKKNTEAKAHSDSKKEKITTPATPKIDIGAIVKDPELATLGPNGNIGLPDILPLKLDNITVTKQPGIGTIGQSETSEPKSQNAGTRNQIANSAAKGLQPLDNLLLVSAPVVTGIARYFEIGGQKKLTDSEIEELDFRINKLNGQLKQIGHKSSIHKLATKLLSNIQQSFKEKHKGNDLRAHDQYCWSNTLDRIEVAGRYANRLNSFHNSRYKNDSARIKVIRQYANSLDTKLREEVKGPDQKEKAAIGTVISAVKHSLGLMEKRGSNFDEFDSILSWLYTSQEGIEQLSAASKGIEVTTKGGMHNMLKSFDPKITGLSDLTQYPSTAENMLGLLTVDISATNRVRQISPDPCTAVFSYNSTRLLANKPQLEIGPR